MKVDIVYLWCSDNDPNFKREKINRAKEVGLFINEEENLNRYVDHQELKYSLRSIEKYAKWINHIYIITNKQTPAWLKTNEKLSIIDHTEIIPQNLLPTFNSNVIEQYLINIKNLSEYFILLNDDIFLNRKTNKDLFFKKNDPIVRFSKIKDIDSVKRIKTPFYSALLNTYDLAKQNIENLEFRYSQHGPDPYSKSVIKEILNKYPETFNKNIFPFRTNDEYIRILWSYEMSYTYHFPTYSIDKISIFKKLFYYIFKHSYYFNFSVQENTNINKFFKKLFIFRPFSFCINYIYPENENKIHNFLENRFSKKSQWEK